MKFSRYTLLLILALILAAATATGQKKIKEITGSQDNPLVPLNRPFDYCSEEGDFRITWPVGCSQIKTRTRMDEGEDDGLEQEQPVIVFCDRGGEKGEGCSVTALFNVRNDDGGPAGPDQVLARMKIQLTTFGADITHQKPLKKDFGDGLTAEGLDVLATQAGGSGQVWLRGLLLRGDIYLLAAWDLKGQVATRPEYVTFFGSFLPGTE